MAVKIKKQLGASLVEILMAIGLITTTLVALLAIVNFSIKVAGQSQVEYKALSLAKEMMEAVRSFRDNSDWLTNGLNVLNLDVNYHLEQNGNPIKWALVAGLQTKDGFTQSIVFSAVRRDVNGNIVASGGNLDNYSKMARVKITWQDQGKTKQIQLDNLLTSWR